MAAHPTRTRAGITARPGPLTRIRVCFQPRTQGAHLRSLIEEPLLDTYFQEADLMPARAEAGASWSSTRLPDRPSGRIRDAFDRLPVPRGAVWSVPPHELLVAQQVLQTWG